MRCHGEAEAWGGIKVPTGTMPGSSFKMSSRVAFLTLCSVPQVSSQHRLEHFSFPDPEEPPPSASLPSQPQAKVIPANKPPRSRKYV